MKLLCTGDLHLGRASSQMPEGAGADWTAAAAWQRAVDLAVQERVAAVLVAGDLVDGQAAVYEALGPLEAGAVRLRDAHIPLVLVAGNHDQAALPRLAEALGPESFTWLGQGGRWSACELGQVGERRVYVRGWSFPGAVVTSDPLETIDELPTSPGDLTLGLLHGDLDQRDSRYAPLSSSRLQQCQAVDSWFLGHLHEPRPAVTNAGRTIAWYVGSPQALDPGETGPHGAWLVEVGEAGSLTAQLVPLSSARYEQFEVGLTGVADRAGFDSAVYRALRERHEQLAAAGPLRGVSCRVGLTGRTAVSRSCEAWAAELRDGLDLSGEVAWQLDRVTNLTRPALELAPLSQGSDPPALLARALLGLEADDDATHPLLDQALTDLAKVWSSSAYQALPGAQPSREDARERLRREGYRLLGALLDQRSPA